MIKFHYLLNSLDKITVMRNNNVIEILAKDFDVATDLLGIE